MSIGIRVAKSQYMGDPGLFSFVSKGLKRVVGSAVGAARGFAQGGFTGAARGAVRGVLGSMTPRMKGVFSQPVLRLGAGPGRTGNQMSPGFGLQSGPGGTGVGFFSPGQGKPAPGGPGKRATHLAKDGSGRMVTNRTMNPLNPRALNRSLRRIVSAKRAAAFLGRITIRKQCAAKSA